MSGLTQERVRKKKSDKLFTRVFLLHYPVFDGQSTVVCSSQGALDFLVQTIKELNLIFFLEGRRNLGEIINLGESWRRGGF